MKTFIQRISLIMFCVSLSSTGFAAQNKTLSLEALVKQFLENYPSVEIAALEISRSQQEFAKVESQLGWVLNADSGVARDVNIVNSPSDTFQAGASLGRQYESGSNLELSGRYTYEDSSSSFSPLVPNPSHRTRLDLKYRIPFGQGENNPNYTQGKINAESNLAGQVARQTIQIDALVEQLMSLFYNTATTYTQIQDTEKSIKRVKRLLAFVQKNRRLGIAESKDTLRVKAQLSAQVARKDSLLVAWSRQRTELNRLIKSQSNYDFVPVVSVRDIQLDNEQTLLNQAYQRDPELALQVAQVKLAESNIVLAKNAQKDKLDVVFSVGAQNTQGDTSSSDVNDSELVGGAQIEYRYDLDQRGFDAELYQSMLDKQLAEEQYEKLKHDIRYNILSLLEQIKLNTSALQSNQVRLKLEQDKLKEALQRYREGRADTSELVDVENDLNASSLSYESQKIELARSYANLKLLLGQLWDKTILQTKADEVSLGSEVQP